MAMAPTILREAAQLRDRYIGVADIEASAPLPPDVLYSLIKDPTRHDQVFEAILSSKASLLERDGPRSRWTLDYQARWNFWKVSGECEILLFMTTDDDKREVCFTMRQAGFLRQYDGSWTITPKGTGSLIQIHAASCPKVQPPFPLNMILKGHVANQIKEQLTGLVAAGERAMREQEEFHTDDEELSSSVAASSSWEGGETETAVDGSGNSGSTGGKKHAPGSSAAGSHAINDDFSDSDDDDKEEYEDVGAEMDPHEVAAMVLIGEDEQGVAIASKCVVKSADGVGETHLRVDGASTAVEGA